MVPLMLEILTTHDVYPSRSSLPFARSPRNAVVTKKIEDELMVYICAHWSNDSLSNSARPRVSADSCCGRDVSLKKRETGPT